jgi:hypothetical protein
VSAFSDHPKEAEVLFAPGTKFRVTRNEVVKRGPNKKPTRIEVWVQEV